jgi:hypothetical protein
VRCVDTRGYVAVDTDDLDDVPWMGYGGNWKWVSKDGQRTTIVNPSYLCIYTAELRSEGEEGT